MADGQSKQVFVKPFDNETETDFYFCICTPTGLSQVALFVLEVSKISQTDVRSC